MSDKLLNYDEIRSDMKDGDVLMFKGTGWLSTLIKSKTNSVYSHAGIVAWWGDRLMVLEAVGKGLEARPISYNLKKYEGGFDYYKSKKDIPAETRQKMLTYAQLQLGKKYATMRMVKFFFKVMLGFKFSQEEKDDTAGVSGEYFCSHYVAAIYNSVGIDLQVNMSDKYTTPEQVAKSDYFEMVGVLKEFKK